MPRCMLSREFSDTSFLNAAARLTVDLGALVQNWQRLRALSGPARTGGVVKADAYGLGASQVAPSLARAGCKDFFVATVEEGARLRPCLPDARIFTLAGIWSGQERLAIENRLTPVVGSLEQAELVRACGSALSHGVFVDTGMNRLGLTLDEARDYAAGDDKPILVMSHLACPDEPAHAMNRQQLESFQAVARLFPDVESSLSSSAGIALGADYHFQLTRPGIGLYGGQALDAFQPLPVATAEARVLQIRHVRAGETASYGASHVFGRDSRIAVIAAGYADGWHRALSGAGVALRSAGPAGGEVFIAGRRAPILGRITMDCTTVDITDLPEADVRPGDYAELFGANICIDETATAAGTIAYELLTSLGGRYGRRYR